MHTRGRAWMAGATGVLLFAAVVVEAPADEAGGDTAVDWSMKAAEAWYDTCRKCHTVPDARFETDRAFLRQITETS